VAKSWQTSAVRQILCSGRIAGLREHHGQAIGPAVWPAIITPAERDCVLARIAARSVTKTRAPRTYLLSGLLRCGRCGNRLFSQARHVNPDNRCHAPLPARPLRCSRRTPVPLLAGRVCVGRSPPPSSAISKAPRMRDLEVIDSELSESSCRAEALREVARRRGRRRATAITLT